jgi:hypothetical protein
MILLLPGNAKNLMQTIKPNPTCYGWLLSRRRTMTHEGLHGLPYAVDNECFTNRFDPTHYQHALARIVIAHTAGTCLFATAPDMVGNAKATLARLPEWSEIIRALGLPVALVGQDGLENERVPWTLLDALFIGGSTQWKLSQAAANLLREAKAQGKWTHIGRVNSVQRASRLIEKPDSVDGTAWARHPVKYAQQWQRWVDSFKPSQASLLST